MALRVAVILIVALDQTPRPNPRVQFEDSFAQHLVRSAVIGARMRLARPECQRVLTDFRDAEGRPLLERVEALSLSPPDYLFDRVWFVDGADTPQCRRDEHMAAFTVPGHQAVRICTGRFGRAFERQMVSAEMIIIHEMLHTLGLGENPPTSHEITEQVRRRCGGS
jgi:hypothetical protein